MTRQIGRTARLSATALATLLGWSATASSQTQVDPSTVSEGLKAIFHYGNNTKETADRLNANTVTVISGTIGGTYVQIAADLASVLDDGNDLRILPIVGRGSVQSIADILFLKGVDVGIVRSDTLDYLEKKGLATNIKKQFTYITKLYNEEMHVVAPKTIRSLADLNGKTVSVDIPNGGTFVTSLLVFERLGIKPNIVYVEQRVAFEKLRKGEIDAMIAVQGRPSKFITQIKEDNLHLVPVDFARPLQTDYLPAVLTAEDYPGLVGKGERVETIAVPAVLAAYNWTPGSDRYRKVERFVGSFFSKIAQFQQPPFHPKWKEVSLTAQLPGWERFRPAQDWLNNATAAASLDARGGFESFLASRQKPNGATASGTTADREALFREFMRWRDRQGQRRQQGQTVRTQ
jgi:TRAP transporter TAXI family solute receptor